MDKDKKIIKLLAVAVFASASVSAFCLAMFAYTYSTGQLPFGFQPMLRDMPLEQETEKEVDKTEKGPGSLERLDEDYLNSFYERVKKEKEKLAEERKKLADEKKIVEDIRTRAKEMQTKVEEAEKRVKSLLVVIDEKEKKNVRNIGSLMAGMEPASALKMLMEFDEDMAARILYMMNTKLASPIIAQAMRTGDEKQLKKIAEITKKMQILSDKELDILGKGATNE